MTTTLPHPLDALLALLTMASLLTSLAAFILFLFQDQDHFAAAGAGYLVTSATSGVLTRTGRRLRLAVSIAASAESLRVENRRMGENNAFYERENAALHATNGELSVTSDRLGRQVVCVRQYICEGAPSDACRGWGWSVPQASEVPIFWK
eukprot:scaffold27724_cov97-Isochrysis_galbana.AAC.3